MTDSRVSREIVQALVTGSPDDRVSREIIQALVSGLPESMLSRTVIQVLYAPSPANTGVVSRTVTQVLVRPKMVRPVSHVGIIQVKNADGTWSRVKAVDQI